MTAAEQIAYPAGRIAYAPDARLGTLGYTSLGQPFRYCTPAEYYTARLWHTFNAVQVFMEIPFALAGDLATCQAVEDQVAEAYWERHDGVLLPPRVVRQIAIVSGQVTGNRLMLWGERWIDDIGRAETYADALRHHGAARSEVLVTSQTADVSALVIATAEILADVFLVSRAIREDIRTAEEERGPNELRGTVLGVMDRDVRLRFEKALDYVLSPEALYNGLSEEAQEAARHFAPYRGRLHERGVLSATSLS